MENVISIPINKPTPFIDVSDEDEKTYLFEGQAGEVFFFARSSEHVLSVGIYDYKNRFKISYENISQYSRLYHHMLFDRFD